MFLSMRATTDNQKLACPKNPKGEYLGERLDLAEHSDCRQILPQLSVSVSQLVPTSAVFSFPWTTLYSPLLCLL